MATLRELKTRIGSVSSSEKITGAMKMISSAKVHKFEQSLRKLTPFKAQIQSIMAHLLEADGEYSSPLTETREVSHATLVVYGSDDGLCGAYNINIFKKLIVTIDELKRKHGEHIGITVVPVGKKMRHACTHLNDVKVDTSYDVDSKMEGNRVATFTRELQNKFLNKETDRVDAVYMNFVSMSKQRPIDTPLFPVDHNALGITTENAGGNKPYIFEPDGNSIFNEVLPMFVLSNMQEITIQNRTSEQAARVMAMQSANDNAKNLLEDLQLEYNKLRQQSITTELLDILGGQVEH